MLVIGQQLSVIGQVQRQAARIRLLRQEGIRLVMVTGDTASVRLLVDAHAVMSGHDSLNGEHDVTLAWRKEGNIRVEVRSAGVGVGK